MFTPSALTHSRGAAQSQPAMFILVFAWLTLAGHFAVVQFCDSDDQCSAALDALKAGHSDALDTRWAVLQPDFPPPAVFELPVAPKQPLGSI